MADFVAVIRRAVDGLAKNTPEMREKVYDKARGAVRRQLENMKPAPPETMIHRQMDKLEAAILSVEAEHAEALPAEEAVAAPAFAPEPVYDDEAPVAEPTTQEVYEPEAAVPAQWPEEPSAPPPVAEEAYVSPEEPYPAHEDVPVAYAEPSLDRSAEQQYEGAPSVDQQSDEQSYQPSVGVDPVEEPWNHGEGNGSYGVTEPVDHYPQDPAAGAQASPEPIGLWPSSEAEQPPVGEPAAESYPEDDHSTWTSSDASPVEASPPVWHDEPVAAGAPVNEDAWQWPEETPQQPEESWQGVPDLAPEASTTTVPESVEAHFEEQTYVGASSVRMPSTEDFPPFDHVVAGEDQAATHGTFDDSLRNPAALGAAGIATASDAAKDPWEDIEGLIGYNQNAMPAGDRGEAPADMDADADMVPPPPRPYRVAPKKRNYTAPILALIGLIVIAAAGYGLWLNRDALNELVGLGEPPAATEPATDASQAPAETAQAPETEASAPAEPTSEGEATAPVAEEVAGTSKFTQRLLADGTEVDEGAGPAEVTGAGQSVAQLNAPPATPADNGAEAGAAPAGAAGATEPSATPEDAAALAGEKMFLYEERVGQTAPTAIEGTVAWSLQREANTGGAQEPVVQGRVNVPGRGLTALITFKRNTDASLPASHLIEIVFAVPPGFEGGAIDSVQRIAMKQTEQDRGDALIAVPAKITDDFHMIALNDFPDARATNLELLRSRNWMDVPLAYRNGRRALLTLQKGEDGMRAFNDAIREWQALSSNGNNGQ